MSSSQISYAKTLAILGKSIDITGDGGGGNSDDDDGYDDDDDEDDDDDDDDHDGNGDEGGNAALALTNGNGNTQPTVNGPLPSSFPSAALALTTSSSAPSLSAADRKRLARQVLAAQAKIYREFESLVWAISELETWSRIMEAKTG